MAFCTTCGKPLRDEAGFCTTCGQAVSIRESATPKQETSAARPNPPSARSDSSAGHPRSAKRRALVVAGAIIVVALAAVALAFSGAFGRGDGNSVGGNSAKVTASAPAVALIATLAGKAGVEGSADGTGATARFAGAASITCDASDNLYVADTGNNTIRKITPDGMVTTLDD